MFKGIIILLTSSVLVYSQEFKIETTFKTSFGSLLYSNKDSEKEPELLFNNQKINNPFIYGCPTNLGLLNKNTEPFDEVLILQETGMGQACNDIGGLHFLGITKTGNTSFLNDSIDVCGVEPIIDFNNNKLVINPIILDENIFGYIPSEIWKYQKGRVFRIDRNPPVVITFRKSTLYTSYVVRIRNFTEDTLNLCFSALGKKSTFISLPDVYKEFGWLEGYSIGANNTVSIGGEGFTTINCFPPTTELSNIKIYFTEEGLGFSLSQEYLQSEAKKYFKTNKKSWLQIFDAELNNAPEILLNENSDRIFANANISISFLIGVVSYEVDVEASGVPYYDIESKGIYLNNIKIENISFNSVPKDKLDGIEEIANEFLDLFLSSYCLKKFNDNDWKFKMVKGIAIKNGRLVVFLSII